jgi:hypothetical protein
VITGLGQCLTARSGLVLAVRARSVFKYFGLAVGTVRRRIDVLVKEPRRVPADSKGAKEPRRLILPMRTLGGEVVRGRWGRSRDRWQSEGAARSLWRCCVRVLYGPCRSDTDRILFVSSVVKWLFEPS